MRPAGQELDRLPADDVIARGSVLWNVHERWDALGIRLFTGGPRFSRPSSWRA